MRWFFSGPAVNKKLIDIITKLNLTAGLQLCGDAGDEDSYTSGNKWLDVSGNGNDFFLGSDGATESEKPTFNGAPGGLSAKEYFLFDDNQFFRYDSTNEQWMKDLWINNAKWTLLFYNWHVTGASGQTIFSTRASGDGILTNFTSGEKFDILQEEGGDTTLLGSADVYTGSQWHMSLVSVDEGGGASGSFFHHNGSFNQERGGSTDLFDAAYSTPGVGNPEGTFTIGARVDDTLTLNNGQRMSMFAMWDTNLSKANADDLWALTRGRFGL